MKVLGIVGSPRNSGSTGKLVESVLEGAREKGRETQVIYFNDLNIKGCQSCQGCKIAEDCAVKDDMHIVYEAVKASDEIVLGTPIYGSQMTSQMKVIFDRFYAFYRADMSIKIDQRKKFSMVVSQGDPRLDLHKDYLNKTMTIFDGRFIKGELLITSGDVSEKPEDLNRAKTMGRSF